MLKTIIQAISRALTWWVIIAPWERGIRLRWGKNAKELSPGIHLRVPLMHQIYKQSTRLLIVDAANQTLTTKDNKVVVIGLVVGFAIENILELYNSIQRPKDTVLGLAMGAIAAYVANVTTAECTPAGLEKHIEAALADVSWGLRFQYVRVTDFAFVKTYRLIGNEHSGGRFWSGDITIDEPILGPPIQ